MIVSSSNWARMCRPVWGQRSICSAYAAVARGVVVMSMHSFRLLDNQPSQESRIVILQGQLKLAPNSPSPSMHFFTGDGILRWPVILLPVEPDAALLPQREVVEVNPVLAQ